ncbi:alternative oxidase [Nannochloropsis gaditana]|uniref:Alternative oxidase n=1 Tax=Nannochloropsis gaditana TaxID=72520 RepID=W7TTV4_9STRA|nr:alternative oxidase [Nannochloropsis gaditana]
MLARAVLPTRSGSLAAAFLKTSSATIMPPKQLQGLSRTLQVKSYRQSTVFYRAMSTTLKPEERAGTFTPAAPSTTTQEKEELRDGARSIIHFKLSPNRHALNVPKLDPKEKVWENPTHHSVWTKEEVENVEVTHLPPADWTSRVAYTIAQTLRFSFDVLAGFKFRKATEDMYLNRMVFLETVAGIPGMAAGMIRHLHSLRRMQRDHGWIHTLLEEAENERMHLLTFMRLKRPGPLFRAAVLVVQGVFFNVFFLSYLINPKICHRLVGHIEEEAVRTYTHIIEEMDAGQLPLFNHVIPPPIAVSYWKLAPDATFRDLLLAIRKDEATHREVNHTFANLKENDDNPFLAEEEYRAKITTMGQPTPVAEKKA